MLKKIVAFAILTAKDISDNIHVIVDIELA